MKHRCGLLGSAMAAGFFCALWAPGFGCLWDTDTLAMERERFPEALEMITGKFVRHSSKLYEWRVKDRLRQIEEGDATPENYDDLAVAYEKLGDHQKAIETILEKDRRFPGRYETYANLATFYFHDGQHERGLVEIDRALSINPQAHFGREVYQRHLVTYILARRADGATTLPLGQQQPKRHEYLGFRGWVLDHSNFPQTPEGYRAETKKALTGVLGMMRFGNHDSPILLEALGDLLLTGSPEDYTDAKRLATRAYLKASYAVNDPAQKEAYRLKATAALWGQVISNEKKIDIPLEDLEKDLRAEMAEGELFFEQIRLDEERWINEGKNPDEEFSRKYYPQSKAAN